MWLLGCSSLLLEQCYGVLVVARVSLNMLRCFVWFLACLYVVSRMLKLVARSLLGCFGCHQGVAINFKGVQCDFYHVSMWLLKCSSLLLEQC